MKLNQLNRDQKTELKQAVLARRLGAKGESPSYGELADADELVSDAELEAEYGGVEFSDDDFSPSYGAENDRNRENTV